MVPPPAFVVATDAAHAQAYPDRTIKIVVPIGTGGSYDLVGRLLADQLPKRLGQSVVVENRTGAGTAVGTQSVIAAPPDGYTLGVGGLSNVVFNSSLYKNSPYHGLPELVPVALVYKFSYILVASNNLPHSTAKELVESTRGKPGTINLAHAGIGTGQHLTGVAFQKFTGTRFVEVPYRASSAVYPDLLSGRVGLFFDPTAAALPYIKSGRVKGIATLTA